MRQVWAGKKRVGPDKSKPSQYTQLIFDPSKLSEIGLFESKDIDSKASGGLEERGLFGIKIRFIRRSKTYGFSAPPWLEKGLNTLYQLLKDDQTLAKRLRSLVIQNRLIKWNS